MLQLKSLAKKCKVSAADLDNNVKDQLISGMRNNLIRYELLKQSTQTLKELIEVAEAVEIADEKAPGISLKNNSSDSSQNSTSEFHSINTARRAAGGTGQQRFQRRGQTSYSRQPRTYDINRPGSREERQSEERNT